MLKPVIIMFTIIVAIAYLNNMQSETYNVDLCLVSYNLHFTTKWSQNQTLTV